jgi:hypothetical protein
VDRSYLDWLASLPINRAAGRPRRSWVGVFSTEDSFETYEQWQARIDMRDAPRGVLARWKRWMN